MSHFFFTLLSVAGWLILSHIDDYFHWRRNCNVIVCMKVGIENYNQMYRPSTVSFNFGDFRLFYLSCSVLFQFEFSIQTLIIRLGLFYAILITYSLFCLCPSDLHFIRNRIKSRYFCCWYFSGVSRDFSHHWPTLNLFYLSVAVVK